MKRSNSNLNGSTINTSPEDRESFGDLLRTGFSYARLALLGVWDRTRKIINPSGPVVAYRYTPARPVELEGCPNLFKVSDILYRGAQPTAAGFYELEKLGVKTVLSLRALHCDRKKLRACGLNYRRIRMKTWDPRNEHILEFLKIVSDPANQPVFVHCLHGSDRTGVLMAAYRIIMQNWPRDKAIREMTDGPFGHHRMWERLPQYLRTFDLNEFRIYRSLPVLAQESRKTDKLKRSSVAITAISTEHCPSQKETVQKAVAI